MSGFFRKIPCQLLAFITAALLLSACNANETVDCARQCPVAKNRHQLSSAQEQKANPSAALSFESLPSAERERLKAKWRDEFRESLKEELRAELADGVVTSKNGQEEPSGNEEEQEVRLQRSLLRPLPPTQDIEKDERGIKVLRHVCSAQINRRQPYDERDVFSVSDGSVYCYVEIAQVLETERNITIKFTHSTGLTQSFELPVGQSPAWRTWSKLNLTKSMTGSWNCEVFNEAGTLLTSKNFVITDEVYDQEPG